MQLVKFLWLISWVKLREAAIQTEIQKVPYIQMSSILRACS